MVPTRFILMQETTNVPLLSIGSPDTTEVHLCRCSVSFRLYTEIRKVYLRVATATMPRRGVLHSKMTIFELERSFLRYLQITITKRTANVRDGTRINRAEMVKRSQ